MVNTMVGEWLKNWVAGNQAKDERKRLRAAKGATYKRHVSHRREPMQANAPAWERPVPVPGTIAEDSVRQHLLNSILRCTHGDLGYFASLHKQAMERDPLFYGHMAGWYMTHGSVRDHQELFIANLMVSPLPEHREHGMVLLQRLRPYQVVRVVRFCKESLHYSTRMLKSAVEFYLRRRENDTAWFDEVVMRDRRSIRSLYASLHIRPSERAEAIVFRNQAPQDSRLHALHQLHRVRENPSYQAELILEHHLHFTTAIGAVRHFTPAVVYALACVMTGPQVVTSLNFLQKRGALSHPETRQVIEEKLKDAVRDGRLSEFKAGVAMRQVAVDEKLAADLLRLTQEKLRTRGRLTVPTAILVDKSGSMEQALAIGKLLACMASTLADSDLHVLAFDSHAFPIRAANASFQAWETAFRGMRADGSTSIGAGIRALMPHRVEQIVVISDGGENVAPYFRPMLEQYEQHHHVDCRVVYVKVGTTATNTGLDSAMSGRAMEVIPFNGDYYSLPNVVPLLCSERYDLVQQVVETPIFGRADLQTLPPGFDPKTYEIL